MLLRGLLASTSLAVLRSDPHGYVSAGSPAAQALLGCVSSQLVGRSVADLVAGSATVRVTDSFDDGDGGRLQLLSRPDAAVDELAARFDLSPVPQARLDQTGLVRAVNNAMETLVGRPAAQLLGRSGLAVLIAADRSPAAQGMGRLVAGEVDRETQERILRRPGGDRVPVLVTATAVRSADAPAYLAVSVQNLAALRAAERAVSAGEVRLEALLRHATDVVVVVDPNGRMLYVSPAAAERLGYDPAQLTGRQALENNHPDDKNLIRAVFSRVQRRTGAVEVFQCRVRHADGDWRWTEQSYTNLVDDPDVGGVVVNLRDITESRRADQDLRLLAVRDSLTGLANRTLLLDRVDQALQRAARGGEQAALVLLDVVAMRKHNKQLGHAGGDALLLVLAERLQAASDEVDSVARVGQDEFAVLIGDVTSTEDVRARTVALLAAATEPLAIAGHEVRPALRSGFAMTPAANAGALLATAERAVRLGDRTPRPALLPGVTEFGVALQELAEAVRLGQLRLHYQPVLRLSDGEVAGVEALVRWQHPQRGLLGPLEFVPLAEASGLVVELGEWVLREACAAQAAWTAAGRRMSVGVNLSPRQLSVPGFDDLLEQVLEESGVRPAQLVLEVTESALMDDDGALQTLQGLHDMGVRLALDDFGTGYSSLTYLKRFPVDALKIDRSFVSGLGRDRDDEAIVASVASLARSVGKAVVAEGVENVEQLQALLALGVDQAQGFMWSRALPFDELDGWLDARRPEPLGAAAPTAPPRPDRGEAAVEARVLALQADGASLQTIAAALNDEGLRCRDGTRWQTRTVARVVAALDAHV